VHDVTLSEIANVMAFRPTKARACFTVARNIAAMFLETRTTVDNVVTSASLESLAAMENVQTSFTTPVIVENATISVPRGLNVNMEHVGMLKIQGF
jgi:hypothetical protein